MTDHTVAEIIAELTERINSLPNGYIAKKTVNGNVYFYHQWSEGGVKKSRYLRSEEIEPLDGALRLRKSLQKELAGIKAGLGKTGSATQGLLKCTLMHKNTAVAGLVIDNETGLIRRIDDIYGPRHLPVGVGVKNGIADRAALNSWWVDRCIPASRSGVREALETLRIGDTRMLLVRCFGLSLSDQYWICPENSGLTWEQVNFFDNDFSEDIGDVLFGAVKKTENLNFSSPDNTSDGNLKKRWKIADGRRCLIKGGSNPYRQQPFNEVIASEIMRRLNIPHVEYALTWIDGAPYSICDDFVDRNCDLVPAWRIIQTANKPNNKSLYRHFVDCADSLGIPGVTDFLDRMIVLDYIIANEDRHLNNFGAVRNAETLEWMGMAPVYDSGSSLGYDKSIPMMREKSETVCKPFKKHHEEQLKLVSSFDWIDFPALEGIGGMIEGILTDGKAVDYVEKARARVIANMTEERIAYLKELAGSVDFRQDVNNDDEVEKNVAASYIGGR